MHLGCVEALDIPDNHSRGVADNHLGCVRALGIPGNHLLTLPDGLDMIGREFEMRGVNWRMDAVHPVETTRIRLVVASFHARSIARDLKPNF